MEGTENRCYLSRNEQLRILTRLTDAVDLRGVHPEAIPRRQELFARRRREPDPAARPGDREGRRAGDRRDRAGHGPPRPAERAGQHHGQEPAADLPRVRRRRSRAAPRPRRREVPPRLQQRLDDRRRPQGPPVAVLQPEPPGVRQPGGASAACGPSRTAPATRTRSRGLALLIHGDAAFAGEGVVQETLNLSELAGYTIGGTLHVVVNNQIGFTTSPPEGRSQHLRHRRREDAADPDLPRQRRRPRGRRPGACGWRMDFRREFQRDVVIDMYCYRRRGHNEGDEPSFTQPLLYQAIAQRKTGPRRLSRPPAQARRRHARRSRPHRRRAAASSSRTSCRVATQRRLRARATDIGGIWAGYIGGREREAADVDTGVDREQARRSCCEAQTQLPADFHPHPKIERSCSKPRREMARGEQPLDWAAAEALAFGQPGRRGLPRPPDRAGRRARHVQPPPRRAARRRRRPHVHAAAAPRARPGAGRDLQQPARPKPACWASSTATASTAPTGWSLWEAQFGDFVNAAQVIIDQFIASAEDKWRRLSGLVLLLAARLRRAGARALQRPARALPRAGRRGQHPGRATSTTPAQYFHCLRRQVLRAWRKPLVVMTPKSLLRHPQAVSHAGRLRHRRLPARDPRRQRRRGQSVERVLLCSGKIYYELAQEARGAQARRRGDPAPRAALSAARASCCARRSSPYADGTPVFWVQEEPENMGAWRFLRVHLGERLFDRFPFCRRLAAQRRQPRHRRRSSHTLEQEKLLAAAFGDV